MKPATLALLALLLAGPAKAVSEMTAGDLYSLCASADENDLTACRFYVFGVVQGVILASTMIASSLKRRTRSYAFPTPCPETRWLPL
jgi:hypothetical protein